MRKIKILIFFTSLAIIILSCNNKDSQHINSYLGENEPGLIPELFGANLATDKDNRHSQISISPDGKEIYYSAYLNRIHPQKILYTKFVNEKWSEPEVANFSGTYPDGGPIFSPDGNRIYFYSRRPLQGDTIINDNYDIWYVERSNDDWSEPVNLDESINSDEDECTSRFNKKGDLYFERYKKDRKHILFKSKFDNGVFQEARVLKELSDQNEFFKPIVIEDEDYFIFTNDIQKGRFFYSYLFISYKKSDGSWTTPKSMGDMINFGEGRFPSLSPDERFLFFTSYRTGISQFYWVDAKIIDYLKNEDLNLIDQLKLIMINNGLSEVKSSYEGLVQKHADYYNFDEILFNQIASDLIDEELEDKAIEIYEFNFTLYPEQKFYSQKLIVSLLNHDKDNFIDISKLITSETKNEKENLLDKLNNAGEIFLKRNRFKEAAKIFALNAEINPKSTWPFYKLGETYFKANNMELAKDYFKKAIELDSTNVYASNFLKEINKIR